MRLKITQSRGLVAATRDVAFEGLDVCMCRLVLLEHAGPFCRIVTVGEGALVGLGVRVLPMVRLEVPLVVGDIVASGVGTSKHLGITFRSTIMRRLSTHRSH